MGVSGARPSEQEERRTGTNGRHGLAEDVRRRFGRVEPSSQTEWNRTRRGEIVPATCVSSPLPQARRRETTHLDLLE